MRGARRTRAVVWFHLLLSGMCQTPVHMTTGVAEWPLRPERLPAASPHVMGLLRVLRAPGGHALLRGPPGSGRSSASRLACFAAGCHLIEVRSCTLLRTARLAPHAPPQPGAKVTRAHVYGYPCVIRRHSYPMRYEASLFRCPDICVTTILHAVGSPPYITCLAPTRPLAAVDLRDCGARRQKVHARQPACKNVDLAEN